MTTQQNFQAVSGNWEDASDWSGGFVATPQDDAAIGDFGDSGALLTNNVTVNSIAVNQGSALTIDGATLTATNGSVTSSADTDVVVTGNHGVINVGDDAVLALDNNFSNTGTLNVGGLANLDINGDVDLSGPGTVNVVNSINLNGDLTVSGAGSINLGANFDQGFIADFGGGAFTNVNDTISGPGQIIVGSFDNQAGGAVNAGAAFAAGQLSDFLDINASSITNAGVINVVADAGLFLNAPSGASASLINSGQINVAGDADIEIGANFTISGAGGINLDGAGAFIASEGGTDWTVTNESTIVGFSSQAEVGQNGADGSFLNLVNQGAIIAIGSGKELIVSTGANVIHDAGGLFEAEDFGHLVIDSAVHTGSLGLFGGLASGTIEATSGGVVTIGASISDGIASPQVSAPGQIVIADGTVEFLAGSSDSIPIEFSGGGGVLEVHSAGAALGAIEGFVSGDALSVTGTSLTSVAIGSDSLAVVTNAGSFDFVNVGFAGAVTGYVAFADPATSGMERVLFTDGNITGLFETNSTIFQAASDTSVNGAGDTIDFQGAAANTTSLSGTDGKADRVDGSGGVIDLNAAQAEVFGGSDSIAFLGTSGNALSLFATAGHFDTVAGDDGSVFLDGAQATLTGAGDIVHFESGFVGNQISFRAASGVRDTVEGSNGVVDLHATSANVEGGGDAIDFISGANDIVRLSDTGSHADLVQGVAGTVDLDGATAKTTSNGDAFAFTGSNSLNLVGTAETMAFSHGIGGLDSITGVGSSDFFQFSKADFADFAALQAHLTQSDGNSVISLNASDSVTLIGVSNSTLEAGQFKFV